MSINEGGYRVNNIRWLLWGGMYDGGRKVEELSVDNLYMVWC